MSKCFGDGVSCFKVSSPDLIDWLQTVFHMLVTLQTTKKMSKCSYCFRVWSIRYNHFHDQLLLSSSSDSRVILHNIISLSSEPFGHLDDEEDEEEKLEKVYELNLTFTNRVFISYQLTKLTF